MAFKAFYKEYLSSLSCLTFHYISPCSKQNYLPIHMAAPAPYSFPSTKSFLIQFLCLDCFSYLPSLCHLFLLESYQFFKANVPRKPPSRTNFSPLLWCFYNPEMIMCITLCLLFTFAQACAVYEV